MKTTRRDFLKGLFATGAALAVAPHLLVELAHGASDLTPQERDVAAEVMGLRTRQWPGYGPSPTGLSARITNAKEGEIVVSGLPPEHWFDAQRHLQGAPEREQEILYGVPGGEMPTGVIDSGQALSMEVYAKFTEEETAWSRVQVPVLLPGDDLISMIEFDVSDREPLTHRRVTGAFVRLCAEREVSKRYPYAARYLRELQNEYDNESKII